MKLDRLASLGASARLIAASGFGGGPVLAATRPTPSAAAALSTSAQLLAWGLPAHNRALDSIMSEVGPDGTVSKQTALQTFSDVIGPLPGVTAGPVPAGGVLDGTFAINWAPQYWDQLTAAQRVAIKKYLPEPPITNDIEPDPNGGARGIAAMTTPPAGPYLAVLKNAESDIAAHIGHPMGLPLHVVVNSKQVGTSFAYTYAYDSHGDLIGGQLRRLYQPAPLPLPGRFGYQRQPDA